MAQMNAYQNAQCADGTGGVSGTNKDDKPPAVLSNGNFIILFILYLTF